MACKESGLKEPKIEEENDFVDVEFYRPIMDKNEYLVSNTVGKPLETDDCGRLRTITDDYAKLSEEERKVLLYLLENTTISRKEVLEVLAIKKTKAHKILASLVEKELIEREGKGRGTYYKLVKVSTDA